MNITVTGTILVSADSKTVFDYISDLANDKFWRKEINSTTMSTRPQLDALAIEDSYLSNRTPSNILRLRCIEFIENLKIVYQTEPGSNLFLESRRQVEPLSQKETRVTYKIEFDKRIVKHGIGIPLPAFLITLIAKKDMDKYLLLLKANLENSDPDNRLA